MAYLVTGATGFIGKRLVSKLLARGGTVYVLMREHALAAEHELRARWGVGDDDERLVIVLGDITQTRCGVSAEVVRELRGTVDHLFHLAAVYDLGADPEVTERVNVEGTANVVALAHSVEAGRVHHVSSIAAAGLYNGIFREDMFAEATGLEHVYYRTKHESERVMRTKCQRPWRIYRPGIVVGDSKTGEMDKIDGPYYFFKILQKLRGALPQWMPTVGVEGGRINVVPVDFVVNAIDHIAHADGEDGKTFHIVDPSPERVGDLMNIFARAAHAPEMAMRINAKMFGFVPPFVRQGLSMLGPVKTIKRQLLDSVGMPENVLGFITYPTRFDCRETTRVLAGSGIECPRIEDYAATLWDYWERNLDPDLFVDRTLEGRVKDQVVVVTGASSGIGKATAIELGKAGAKVVLVARTLDKLKEVEDEIHAGGGQAFSYACDIAKIEDCDALVAAVTRDHGAVAVLVNNAGRSIRRSIRASYDRFHDYERTMQLNYFGALRLILGFLPGMVEAKRGHIVNVSSIGVLTNAARFSAYVASKAALDAFSRCARSEFAGTGVSFTYINMPLVRTPMIAPTALYRNVPTISPEEAAGMVVEAIVRRPEHIATRLGKFARMVHGVSPRTWETLINTGFRMFPDSAAARGEKTEKGPTPEQIAIAQLMRGIHW